MFTLGQAVTVDGIAGTVTGTSTTTDAPWVLVTLPTGTIVVRGASAPYRVLPV